MSSKINWEYMLELVASDCKKKGYTQNRLAHINRISYLLLRLGESDRKNLSISELDDENSLISDSIYNLSKSEKLIQIIPDDNGYLTRDEIVRNMKKLKQKEENDKGAPF